MINNKKKVIVALSGGVDSSVSAWLLKKQGYKVECVFMKNWEEDNQTECLAKKDLADSEAICDILNIKLHIINFSAEYWDNVFKPFLLQYQLGYTPNPDILCNKEIKFKYFLELAKEDIGADYIATGHYVRRLDLKKETRLLKGIDKNKDQSYFLYSLHYKQIAQCLFPIGHLNKKEVRKIAQELKFINANKKDSTGICFIGKRKFRDFLSIYLPNKHGPIVTTEGHVIGKHHGLIHYTLGQRKGIGIGGLAQYNGDPWYVVEKNLLLNQLIVAQGSQNPRLMSTNLIAKSVNWINGIPINKSFRCTVKTRYRQRETGCIIQPINENRIKVIFDDPIAAVTPGQSAVFYLDECCLGGGIIESHQTLAF
ncbi:tRNA 2-thiouridine(34) synthase MnmA [Candidatus Schneideria nysicola]|uniref:tRNA 2-thiouridine(34) synthase MnmA n=1 Tax=Candidatus Schneideria nysicola TaxID=1081631 RepID=UPI001CAA6EF4|nr:tRNA 2-thiouridine(34) synthase MnmA [Candidatus Schneideria nysicola]UAJ65183.1 tRNA 2-thiouridine(34) synthase MnmA [Candidatus Schneideria nysicola]